MHICQIMVSDFLHGTGRYDKFGQQGYSDYNLQCLVMYCEDWIGEGRKRCPTQGWDLGQAMAWARARLLGRPSPVRALDTWGDGWRATRGRIEKAPIGRKRRQNYPGRKMLRGLST